MLAIIFINDSSSGRGTKISNHSLAVIHFGEHSLQTAVYLFVQSVDSVDFVHDLLLVDYFFDRELGGFRSSCFLSVLSSEVGDVDVLLQSGCLVFFGFCCFFDEVFLGLVVFVGFLMSVLWDVGGLVFSFERFVLSHVAFLCKSIEILGNGCFGGLSLGRDSFLRPLESGGIGSSSILKWFFLVRGGMESLVRLIDVGIAVPGPFVNEGVVDLGSSADGRGGKHGVLSVVSACGRILVGVEIEVFLDLGVDVVLESLFVVVHAIVRLQ